MARELVTDRNQSHPYQWLSCFMVALIKSLLHLLRRVGGEHRSERLIEALTSHSSLHDLLTSGLISRVLWKMCEVNP